MIHSTLHTMLYIASFRYFTEYCPLAGPRNQTPHPDRHSNAESHKRAYEWPSNRITWIALCTPTPPKINFPAQRLAFQALILNFYYLRLSLYFSSVSGVGSFYDAMLWVDLLIEKLLPLPFVVALLGASSEMHDLIMSKSVRKLWKRKRSNEGRPSGGAHGTEELETSM